MIDSNFSIIYYSITIAKESRNWSFDKLSLAQKIIFKDSACRVLRVPLQNKIQIRMQFPLAQLSWKDRYKHIIAGSISKLFSLSSRPVTRFNRRRPYPPPIFLPSHRRLYILDRFDVIPGAQRDRQAGLTWLLWGPPVEIQTTRKRGLGFCSRHGQRTPILLNTSLPNASFLSRPPTSSRFEQGRISIRKSTYIMTRFLRSCSWRLFLARM